MLVLDLRGTIIHPHLNDEQIRECLEKRLSSAFPNSQKPSVLPPRGFFSTLFSFGSHKESQPRNVEAPTIQTEVSGIESLNQPFLDLLYRALNIRGNPHPDDVNLSSQTVGYITSGVKGAYNQVHHAIRPFLLPQEKGPWKVCLKGIEHFNPLLEYRPFAVFKSPHLIKAQDLYSGAFYQTKPVEFPELDGFESPVGPLSRGGRNLASIISLAFSKGLGSQEYPVHPRLVSREVMVEGKTPSVFVPLYLIPFSAEYLFQAIRTTLPIQITSEHKATISWDFSGTMYASGGIFLDALNGEILEARVSHFYFNPKKKEETTLQLTMVGTRDTYLYPSKGELPPPPIKEKIADPFLKIGGSVVYGVCAAVITPQLPPVGVVLGLASAATFLNGLSDLVHAAALSSKNQHEYETLVKKIKTDWKNAHDTLKKSPFQLTYP